MNEVLNKLLESELLTDESKKELEEAFTATLHDAIEEAVDVARNEVIAQTKVELHEQYAQQKELLIDALESKVNEYLVAEIAQLKEDIKSFRDLEAEKAIELAKEKAALSEQLKADMVQLVEKLDRFLDVRIANEFEELRSDIQEAKKLDFGRRIIEAFSHEYRKYFVDATATEKELVEAKACLDDLNKKYKSVKKEKAGLTRKIKMESILAPLKGSQKDLMESILSSVATEKLEESYKLYIKRVLKETAPVSESKKEDVKVDSLNEDTFAKLDSIFESADHKVITGDSVETIVESQVTHTSPADDLKMQMMRLAGIGSY